MKRRVIVVTDTTYRTLLRALNYVIEAAGFADYDGDHSRGDAQSFEHARRCVAGAPLRDVAGAAQAIISVAHDATTSACSGSGSGMAGAYGHATDCYVATSKQKIDRVLDVAAILKGAAS